MFRRLCLIVLSVSIGLLIPGCSVIDYVPSNPYCIPSPCDSLQKVTYADSSAADSSR